MSRRNEEARIVRRPVGAAAVSMVLSAAITAVMVAGIATAPVRLPADVQAAFHERAAQARFASLVAGDVGGSLGQNAANVLLDSSRR